MFYNCLKEGMLMVKVNNIRDINHVKEILDNMRNYVAAYEEQNGDLSENTLENLTFQICEIDEFIIATQKINNANLANGYIRMMTYWKYIDGKYSFWDMIGELKKYEGEI